jgi:hypothetical protein
LLQLGVVLLFSVLLVGLKYFNLKNTNKYHRGEIFCCLENPDPQKGMCIKIFASPSLTVKNCQQLQKLIKRRKAKQSAVYSYYQILSCSLQIKACPLPKNQGHKKQGKAKELIQNEGHYRYMAIKCKS